MGLKGFLTNINGFYVLKRFLQIFMAFQNRKTQATTFSVMTFNITTPSIMTHSITTLPYAENVTPYFFLS
jgi:hypothetical protein